MEIPAEKIEELRKLIDNGPRQVVIVTHTNPDGDAIGSTLAWGEFLEQMGHSVSCIIPNKYPYFLDWMPGINKFLIFKEQPDRVREKVEQAEIIFCLDLNQITRLEALCDAIAANTTAKSVLIDHHMDPPPVFDIEFSHVESSSTSYIVYSLIEILAGTGAITREMADSIYVGIMTDTGNFSYSHLPSDLFRAVAVLVDKGVDIPAINREIYNNFTSDRVKLLGYALNKMEILPAGKSNAAYITLSEAELRRFRFQQGDSEGFVNFPLSIGNVIMSAIFIQTRQFIRVSLRSRGDVDVSLFANRFFEGGGHKNAAGGKSFVNMEQTVENYRQAVRDFFGES